MIKKRNLASFLLGFLVSRLNNQYFDLYKIFYKYKYVCHEKNV